MVAFYLKVSEKLSAIDSGSFVNFGNQDCFLAFFEFIQRPVIAYSVSKNFIFFVPTDEFGIAGNRNFFEFS